MTVFMEPAVLALASALRTRKKTRTGATAFSALTNSVPSRSMIMIWSHANAWEHTPRTAPMTRPMTMRQMRLIEFHFLKSSMVSPNIIHT